MNKNTEIIYEKEIIVLNFYNLHSLIEHILK